jgi:hypothetical protein
VPNRPGFVSAASRPPRRLPDRTALSSHQTAATAQRGGLSHLLRFPAPHGAPAPRGALRLPSAPPPCCDRDSGEGLSPPLEPQRLTAHVELRHSFTVASLLDIYRDGGDVQARIGPGRGGAVFPAAQRVSLGAADGRYYKTRKQVDAPVAQILAGPVRDLLAVRTGTKAGKPVITWARDTAAITAASQLDGLYALAANLPDHDDGTPLTALDVLETCKDQWIVEQRHRDLKQTLRVRPVFLHNDDRIEALIAIIGIALLIFGLSSTTSPASSAPSWPC